MPWWYMRGVQGLRPLLGPLTPSLQQERPSGPGQDFSFWDQLVNYALFTWLDNRGPGSCDRADGTSWCEA